MKGTMQRITVSLPKSLLAYIDDEARKRKVSRSRMVIDAIESMRRCRLEEVAAEGYRFYANESVEFAAASQTAVTEALGNPITDWQTVNRPDS